MHLIVQPLQGLVVVQAQHQHVAAKHYFYISISDMTRCVITDTLRIADWLQVLRGHPGRQLLRHRRVALAVQRGIGGHKLPFRRVLFLIDVLSYLPSAST